MATLLQPLDPTKTARKYVRALDGLRGVAILMVLFHHFIDAPMRELPGLRENLIVKSSQRVGLVGWIGVDLFFVLSGFLITGIAFDEKDAPHFLKNFYARRTLRIFPLYYALLLLVLIGTLLIPSARAAVPLDQFFKGQLWLWTYTTNFAYALDKSWTAIHTPGVFVAHFWSLAVEEQFYLVWPFALMWLSRTAALRVCVGAIVAALLLRVILLIAGVDFIPLNVLMPCRMDALAAGALLVLWLRGETPYTQIRRKVLPVAAIAAVIGAIILFLPLNDKTHGLVSTIGYSCNAIAFAGLIVIAINPIKSLAPRLLESKLLVFFGRYSYGIYVLHGLLLGSFIERLSPTWFASHLHSEIAGMIAFMLAGTGVAVLLAMISFHFLEKPFLALKDRFFKYEKNLLQGPVSET